MKSKIRICRNQHDAGAFPCGAAFLLVAQVLIACTGAGAEGIRFRTQSYCAVLGADAVWQSLVEPTTDRSFLATDRKTPFAYLQLDGKIFSATSAQREGDRLIVGFDGVDTQLEFVIEQAEHWVTFQIERITGSRPQRITFLRIGIDLTAHVGIQLNGAWDEQSAVVVRGTNRQTVGRPIPRAGSTELTAMTQDEPGPKLEGSAASLLVVPTSELKSVLNRFAEAYSLPTNTTGDGVASKDTHPARGSYWFLSFAANEVDQVIEYCQKAGFRQVMLNSGAWCTSPGHYLFDTTNYPGGIDSLKQTVQRLHAAGILVGMHCFASKVSKRDPYVTPVPDRRFLVDRQAQVAVDLTADGTTIRTSTDLSQWPGSPLAKQKLWEGGIEKHREFVIDNEIIQYEAIGPDGRWDTFLGCRRGAWGTKADSHKAGDICRQFAVDGCINGYIIDQEMDLLNEVTDRLAAIFNTCDFDMVYFDGCEDVDRRRHDYYAANFQAVAMSKFQKRPLIHKGGGFHHNLWHSFTSSATIDQYPGTYLAYLRAGGTIDQWPTCKDHIDRTVRRVIDCRNDLIPGELGWFGINPADGRYDGLQYDEIEYLLCKSLAYDAPISLQTSFARMQQHPLTDDILAMVKRYEALRHHQYGRVPIAGLQRLSAEDLIRLRQPGRDFHVDTKFQGVPLPVEMSRLTMRDDNVRAWLGTAGDTYLLRLWHSRGRAGELILDTDLGDADSKMFTKQGKQGRTVIPIDHRCQQLEIRGVSGEALRTALETAEFKIRPPRRLWIAAEDFTTCVGALAKGSTVAVEDPDAIGDFVLGTGRIDPGKTTRSYCQYRVQIPTKGIWTLWARVRYPRGGDMSFGLSTGSEDIGVHRLQVLGNCGVNDAKWHWTGRGGGVTTIPPGSPIRLQLEQGEFVFRVYPREGPGTVETNPRLDVICLCEASDNIPTDEETRRHFQP